MEIVDAAGADAAVDAAAAAVDAAAQAIGHASTSIPAVSGGVFSLWLSLSSPRPEMRPSDLSEVEANFDSPTIWSRMYTTIGSIPAEGRERKGREKGEGGKEED